MSIAAVHECLSTSEPRQTVCACNCTPALSHERSEAVNTTTQLQSNIARSQIAKQATNQEPGVSLPENCLSS